MEQFAGPSAYVGNDDGEASSAAWTSLDGQFALHGKRGMYR